MTDSRTLSRAWRGLETPSTEHLELELARGVTVTSRVVRGDVSIEYTADLDADWTFRTLRATRADGLTLELARDRRGRWTADGAARADLSGAVDIDMVITPFTNTLPLRRLDLEVGGAVDIVTAWVDENLHVFPDPQRYTRIDRNRYLFESDGGAFVREIVVDSESFIADYPGLFVALDTE